MLLAIIGPDWLTAERDGQRRLDDPDDWVRREIGIALGMSRVQVIPVMVGDAELPTPEQLPEPLSKLPGRQAITVRPDRFEDDVENLIERIGGWRRRWHGFALWTWVAAAAVVIALLAAAFVIRSNRPPVLDLPGPISAVGETPVEIDLLPWIEDEDKASLRFSFGNESIHGGSVLEMDEGVVTYVGPPRYRGPDSFGFTVTDDHNETQPGTVSIDVTLGSIGGLFNVAVAEFAAVGQAPAATVSESLFVQIDSLLGAETEGEIEVAGPSEVGLVGGDTPEIRAEAAARLAEETTADIVVYGALETQGGVSRISAEFYLSNRSVGDVEELVGSYVLDTEELGPTAPAGLSRRVNQLLAPKVEALAKLAMGLSHYQIQEYAEARGFFLEAEEDWPGASRDNRGQEVIYHLLGNVSGLLGDLDAAESYYESALTLNPGYARARFGVAEVKYQRAIGTDCLDGDLVDRVGLESAISEFEGASAMPAPELSFIGPRSQVEIARIYLCLLSIGVDRREEAVSVLEGVLADLAAEPRAADLAAEAHATLGAFYMTDNDDLAAANEFKTAVETTLDPTRQGAFYQSLAYIYLCRIPNEELGEEYFQKARSFSEGTVERPICQPQ